MINNRLEPHGNSIKWKIFIIYHSRVSCGCWLLIVHHKTLNFISRFTSRAQNGLKDGNKQIKQQINREILFHYNLISSHIHKFLGQLKSPELMLMHSRRGRKAENSNLFYCAPSIKIRLRLQLVWVQNVKHNVCCSQELVHSGIIVSFGCVGGWKYFKIVLKKITSE